MYSRIVTVQVNPDKTEEAIAIFRDSVIPAAKQQKGFISLMMLMDRSSGKGMAVGVWESEADLNANEASGYYQEQLAKFGGLFTAPPMRDVYEVGASS